MAEIPHKTFPDTRWWARSVGRIPQAEVDPVVNPKFKIAETDKVVTAGSCFAQHIAKRLQKNGFCYHVTERAPASIQDEVATAFNYGTFSARYGNIYTARQLVQLIDRAYGRFQPVDDVWEQGGSFYDPYRPQIQPDGFASLAEYRAERWYHFEAVRRALEDCDVFIFTLGLTEAWINAEDGAVYPVVPGGSAGSFDPAKHVFHNFTVEEVIRDLRTAIGYVRDVNPDVRILLTVSPVPLIATAADEHVLVSTVYSKSVLRVAAAAFEADPAVAYFPSYEIVTGPHARGNYFAADLREVTEAGVDHVMKLVFRHYTDFGAGGTVPVGAMRDPVVVKAGRHLQDMEERSDIVCDEEVLERTAEP